MRRPSSGRLGYPQYESKRRSCSKATMVVRCSPRDLATVQAVEGSIVFRNRRFFHISCFFRNCKTADASEWQPHPARWNTCSGAVNPHSVDRGVNKPIGGDKPTGGDKPRHYTEALPVRIHLSLRRFAGADQGHFLIHFKGHQVANRVGFVCNLAASAKLRDQRGIAFFPGFGQVQP